MVALKKGITLAKKPPIKRHKSIRVKKTKYLNDVKNRLNDDILPYLSTVNSVYKKTGKGIGFWALTRMIFPVIESVANTIYRDKSLLIKRARLLRNLYIEYPFLTWEMFRNTLIHNDEMTVAYYKGKKVIWSLSIGDGHKWEKGILQIDLSKLLTDFINFLDVQSKAPKNQGKTIWIKESFKFTSSTRLETRNEVLELGQR